MQQFKFLLPELVKHNHDVVFLSLESHGIRISGVKHFKISAPDNTKTLDWELPIGLGKKISVSSCIGPHLNP